MPVRMTGYAIADSLKVGVRDAGHQIRDTCMTEGTIVVMGYDHRREGLCSRIVAGETCGRYRHIVFCRVAAVHGHILVRVAIQTVGRVGLQGDGVDNFLTFAVVAGGTRAGAVDGDVMLDTFNLGPGRNHVTFAAELTRATVGEISGTNSNGMGNRSMTGVAIETGDQGAAHALSNHFADGLRIHNTDSIGMTCCTASVQSVNISRAGQIAGAWGTKICGIAGMTGAASCIDDPVVMR